MSFEKYKTIDKYLLGRTIVNELRAFCGLCERAYEIIDLTFFTKRNIKTKRLCEIVDIKQKLIHSLISDNVYILKNLPDSFFKHFDNSFIISESIPYESFNKFYDFNNNVLFIDKEISDGKRLNDLLFEIKNSDNDVIIGIGGGRVMDIIKFISYETGKLTLAIPTSLSSHVYASPKIHVLPQIREMGYELTINSDSSHLSLLDLDFLNYMYKKEKRLIMAGFGDIMAFINGREDWILASKRGLDKFDEVVNRFIDFIIEKLKEININKDFKEWINEYVLIQVLLCNITDWVGSAPASGAEHMFAHKVEQESHTQVLHGEMVALGTLIFSYIRKKNLELVVDLMGKFNLSRNISEFHLTRDMIVNSLVKAIEEGKLKNRYTILNEINITHDLFNKIIDDMINEGFIYE